VELRLELVPSVRANRVDPEWETLDHVIHEGDRALLRVPSIDPESSDPRRVVDGRVLISLHAASVRAVQREKLHVYLHVVARNAL